MGFPHPICGCGYRTEDLPHARASSRWGYDPDGPVVMAPFQGSKLEDFPRQLEVKRSCQRRPGYVGFLPTKKALPWGDSTVTRIFRPGVNMRWRTDDANNKHSLGTSRRVGTLWEWW
ncbi:hypothetical protein EVAR_85996_1 [Eumeta japonica]|uniref:Uncharacterized protein n=1 Tax=Eumeta variegata TaxID=151549 RepID=A0A4C1UKT3_EUMVA|nr:hypothetical protein EVAR_85996_1 [Eumeta japonica]